MPAKVSLQDVVEAMDLPNQEWESFLDPESGEIITVTDEDHSALAAEDEDLPEWQREQLPKLREVVGSDRFLQLPDATEIHEWSIMERFSQGVEAPAARDALLVAIHGRGAFRMFRATLERFELRDEWYAFRGAVFEEIARSWLREHGIPFE